MFTANTTLCVIMEKQCVMALEKEISRKSLKQVTIEMED